MSPALEALIALQTIDSAIDTARRRLNELPAAEQTLDDHVAAADAVLQAAKARLAESHNARRALEKDVAGIDARLARFDDHRAAIKTNQEYTALLHEIGTAKAEKDAAEERILIAMEASDEHAHAVKADEAALAAARSEAAAQKAALAAERTELETEVGRHLQERARHVPSVDPRALAAYERLLKDRRGVAVAQLIDGHCSACHVRLRPHVEQQVRRNDTILNCDSCQRILYFVPKEPVQ